MNVVVEFDVVIDVVFVGYVGEVFVDVGVVGDVFFVGLWFVGK